MHEKCNVGKVVETVQVSTDGEKRQVKAGVVSRTANRRSREAYNAYQREYMRERRKKKS